MFQHVVHIGTTVLLRA